MNKVVIVSVDVVNTVTVTGELCLDALGVLTVEVGMDTVRTVTVEVCVDVEETTSVEVCVSVDEPVIVDVCVSVDETVIVDVCVRMAVLDLVIFTLQAGLAEFVSIRVLLSELSVTEYCNPNTVTLIVYSVG